MKKDNKKESWEEIFVDLWERISDMMILFISVVFINSVNVNKIFKPVVCLILIVVYLLKYWFSIGKS